MEGAVTTHANTPDDGTVMKKNRFALNALSGVAAQGITSASGIILMPYAMARLGVEGYGVYQLARSALVLFQFLQLGMGPTLVRYCADAFVKLDSEKLARTGNTAQMIMSVIASAAMAISIFLIPRFVSFYAIPTFLERETTGMLLCMAGCLVLNLIIIVPRGLILGANRYDVANGIEAITGILQLGLIVLSFEFIKPSVLLLGISMLIAQGFRYAATFVGGTLLAGPQSLLSPSRIDKKMVGSLASFSSLNLLNAIAAFFIIRGPLLIVGKTLGLEAVSYFAPAVLVASTLQGFLGRLSNPLVPMASKAKAEGTSRNLGSWATSIGTVNVLMGLTVVLAFSVCGPEIITLWLGATMTHVWIFVAVLSLETTLSQSAAALYYLALGGADIRPIVFSQIVVSLVIGVGVTWGTASLGWNLLDVALYILFCRCWRNVLYITHAYANVFGYSRMHYLRAVYAKPMIIACAIGTTGWSVSRLLIPNEHTYVWVSVLLFVLLSHAASSWLLLPTNLKSTIRQLCGQHRRTT